MRKLYLKKHSYKGKLIVFEGVDGSGKTTLLEVVSEYLKSKNIEHTKVKMPSDFMRQNPVFHAYDNSLDNTVRKTANLTNLTIFVSGDRLVTLDNIIIPALKDGRIVLCDRYCFTGYAHCQNKIIRQITNRFIKPDIVFLPIADLATVKQRVKMRPNEKDNYYDEKKVEKLMQNFLKLAKKQKFIVIDTEKNQKEINNQLLQNIKIL